LNLFIQAEYTESLLLGEGSHTVFVLRLNCSVR